jgi:alkylhydroperoxidase/carboxymuconolactone decarboxylase family protein YurZ
LIRDVLCAQVRNGQADDLNSTIIQEVFHVAKQLPKAVNEFRKRHPNVWKAFNELGDRCHEGGPLDEKSRRLVKLALAIGAGLEGATHSAVRNARKSGITPKEMDHVALLAITTLGMPAATRAMTWIGDISRGK